MTTRETLRELAAKATPGPWTTERDERRGSNVVAIHSLPVLKKNGEPRKDGRAYTPIIAGGVLWGACRDSDAAYIAALSPARILALLDVVESVESMRGEWKSRIYGLRCCDGDMSDREADRYQRVIDALAALDAVLPRKDAPDAHE